MADLRTPIEDTRTLIVGGTATIVAAGLAWLAAVALTSVGATPDSTAGWLGIPALVAFAVASGFAVGRSGTRERRATDSIEVAALAHDLRAPLASARTLLQLLQSGAVGNLNAEAMDTATRASTAVGRAQAVLEGALRARTAVEEAPTANLDTALDRALQAVAGGIAQSGAIIERRELPTVRADAVALERVLVNLVVNSIAHARPGQTPHIEVDAQQEGQGWLISVRDNGPGVPAQIRDRAFEPGVRGFSPDGPAGFGLGLSTVRRLVEQQGGRAWLDPDTTDGTCVRMLLPAA